MVDEVDVLKEFKVSREALLFIFSFSMVSVPEQLTLLALRQYDFYLGWVSDLRLN